MYNMYNINYEQKDFLPTSPIMDFAQPLSEHVSVVFVEDVIVSQPVPAQL